MHILYDHAGRDDDINLKEFCQSAQTPNLAEDCGADDGGELGRWGSGD